MRKKLVRVDQVKYDLAKLLMANGLRGQALMQVTHLGSACLSTIRQSKSLEDYKEITRRNWNKAKASKVESTEKATPTEKALTLHSSTDRLLIEIRDILLADQQVMLSIKNRIVQEDRTNPIVHFFKR